ncbi:MAG: 3'-5' exonuclease [Bacteroidetes bacterium GWF2_33_16]|nr:MAG: 3'-5' exonuclease [Bacteroidetes bacterium GWE2_32_14]OFY08948.1 MAG: 3'-5' exonuclease [Bacteroidetes bacterium GWF2_33_16]
MLDAIKVENVLFIDIETIPQYPDFNEAPEQTKNFWEKKSSHFRDPDKSAADVYQRAGIYSEFGRIICISAGIIIKRNDEKTLRIKSFFGDDEKQVLVEFAEMLKKYHSSNKDLQLCAHNGKEFDFPYIARRMIINDVKIPQILDVAGKKPWEVQFLDTMELWKFGDYKNYTSLNLLTYIFNIPTPKDDIDGSMVADVYWKEKNLERIVIYCEKDVLAIAQVFLKYKGDTFIKPENIESASTQS